MTLINVHLIDEKKRPLGDLRVDDTTKVVALKVLIHDKFFIPVSRQRILTWTDQAQWHHLDDNKQITADRSARKSSPTKRSKVSTSSSSEESLQSLTLLVKDLGYQVGWRLVFLLEYLGPILVHLYYAVWVYKWTNLNLSQRIAFLLFIAHFMKREFETVVIHRFSHDTMPLANLFKNCGYYWGVAGWLVARQLYSQGTTNIISQGVRLWLTVGLFILFEACNFKTHVTLRNLRPPGTTKRAIPHGLGFSPPLNLACPNYFFESLSWFSFALLVRTWSTWIFFLIGTAQMWSWASKKHVKYIKEFGSKYVQLSRNPMFPGIPF